MDSREFRGLQEAYMEVIMSELDEGYKELPVDKMVAKSKSLARIPREPGAPRWDRNAQRGSDIRKAAGTHSRAKVKKVEKENRERGTQKEEVDLYDIILSHLLDEGYAETEEAAEAIMVNMSEEWRESLISEYFSIGSPSVGGGGSRGPSERERKKQEREKKGHELKSRLNRVVRDQRRGHHGMADSQTKQSSSRKDYDPNSGWAHYYDQNPD